MAGLQSGSRTCSCTRAAHDTRLVAVTGGPGAGKTAILEMALASLCSHIAVLPEAASVVFGGGFPRHDTEVGRAAAQRAIFHVQRELEAVVLGEGRVAVGLCDRGTVDGLAYWHGSPEAYWRAVGSSEQAELERYSAVIHLRTPAATQGYNHDNVLRLESAAQAAELDRRVLTAWTAHPRRYVVDSVDDFADKAARALAHVREALPECCRAHLQAAP
ncbi:MAG: hypothetical protein EP330_09895 [Deltaproteobacteria bacterium]|nr:MAG: hypothetical protein EP330_09895 [Deltaproteobacteria bacterium]